jgi:hypothetical protein
VGFIVRLAHETGEVPFDGLLTQAGEVFFKLHNYGGRAMNMTVPRVDGHAKGWWTEPFWNLPLASNDPSGLKPATAGCSQHGGPLCPVITVPAGGTSPWVDVGGLMDAMDWGSWNPAGVAANASDPRPVRIARGDTVILHCRWLSLSVPCGFAHYVIV